MLAGTVVTAHAASQITVGSATRDLSGTNIYRAANYLVKYTPARGATTRSNSYGFEAAVVGGKVTRVENSVGNMAIPSNGFVLSGHGDARTWLQANAVVGANVSEDGAPPPPPPPPPPGDGGTPETANTIKLGEFAAAVTRNISAHNTRRLSNQLIRYTAAFGATTDTNQYGFEAAVLNGKVTKIEEGVGNMAIPQGGYVLSGHGDARMAPHLREGRDDCRARHGQPAATSTSATPSGPAARNCPCRMPCSRTSESRSWTGR